MNASKIDVATRRALVKPVTEFAKAHELSVGFVMSAVLWAGEKQPNEITNMVNAETVASYNAELARREAARSQQVAGMVANASFSPHRRERAGGYGQSFRRYPGSSETLHPRTERGHQH